ncbi:MAG TPA: hypothetical protein VFD43_12730 [Planctomycetota bacterium]|nr:hypothetical protein [Planctomycetota bacterium]
MKTPQPNTLQWLAVAVGVSAAAVTAAWIWLTRFERLPVDDRLTVAGFGLLALVMALRCGRLARTG